MEFTIHELPNGLRIVYHSDGNPTSHIGLFIGVGTRDEKADEQGIAHFMEHTMFKGTSKRKSYQILSRLDAVGGELNAYTTKEETCLHASVLSEHTERAIEILADVSFNSIFPEKEIEKEKAVVIDEIYSYLDSPSEQIYDEFEELLFKNHPLSGNILGTESSVKRMSKKNSFNSQNRTTNRQTWCSASTPHFQ